MSFYFLAIPLPMSLKEALATFQKQYEKVLPYRQWTYMDDYHITLKFLGPVEEDQLNLLQQEMKQVNSMSPFVVNIGSLRTFGTPKRPRVLWVGVEKKNEIMDLYECVQTICQSIGFAKESRPFQPHITLGKKWEGPKSKQRELQQLIKAFSFTEKLTVTSVVLFQIQPSKQPKYQIVNEFALSGGEKDRPVNQT